MITRRHRFHGYGSLNAVYKQGKTVRGQLLSLRYGHREASRPYRVAVVVSRKVHKSAVVRNRIRRRIYEAVRLQGDAIPDGTDLVFSVFNDKVGTTDAENITVAVSDLLKKVTN